MSNSLVPDQARLYVGPDLGPNCLQKLSADDTSRYKVNLGLNECVYGSCWPTYPNCFNPTLNIKMVFGEKIPKMGTFSDFVTIFFVNVITKFNNFPTYLP